jgi:hypothetical protein
MNDNGEVFRDGDRGGAGTSPVELAPLLRLPGADEDDTDSTIIRSID